ncbi:MAG: potassium-transporting ATPase subunit KdpC [Myxococcaceae bacterium]
MRSLLAIAVRTTLLTLLLTGLLYPLAVTGAALLLFPARASGSWLADERGQVVGSELLAQGFSSPSYFQPRPSAAGAAGYDATASSGSNLGPTSKKLRDGAAELLKKLEAENPLAPRPVPAELVTASASGLDPHLSPEAAQWQVRRVAAARGLSEERVRAVLVAHSEERTFGFLGEPRVNVLVLNLALDRQFGRPVLPPPAHEAPAPAAH